MKKHLLTLAVLTAVAATAPAQTVTINYSRPVGTFYYVLSAKTSYSQDEAYLAVPNNTDLSFTSHHQAGATRTWDYVDKSANHANSSDSILTLNYSFDEQTVIDGPTLTGTQEDYTDNTYKVVTHLVVGGNGWGEADDPYYWGNHPYNLPGMGRTSSTNYFLNNEASFNNWISRLQGAKYYGENFELKAIKGWAEKFDKPVVPYELRGVHIRAYDRDQTLDGDVRITIKKVADRQLLAQSTIALDDITKLDDPRQLYLHFTNLQDADGQSIDNLVIDDAVFVTLEALSSSTQLMPLHWVSKIAEGESYIHLYGDYKDAEGTEHKDDFVDVTNNGVSAYIYDSFCYYLDASYVESGNTTGIEAIASQTAHDAAAPAYNLAGQRVGASYRGLIVKDGKKYVSK